MTTQEILNVITQEGGLEIVNQLKTLINAKATAADIASALEGYSNTEAVQALIKTAVDASEKKIFGDGELAEAFDTIKEIGDYLKDHDDVAKAINEAIAKKVDKETYEEDKEELEGKISGVEGRIETAEGAINDLKEELGISDDSDTPGSKSVVERVEDLETALEEDYLKSEDAEATYVKAVNIVAVPVATIQGWFQS